ncbi:uncharacterized protein LOC133884221 [Phragmites australis]|uniref:uncharacterized protein LOC133884221 n=1 Tax=Phragmites australis TaxID=29695 RepID=UPI002D765D73|nr:uncharacterized protein LOC133884221 [Phragmites australis]
MDETIPAAAVACADARAEEPKKPADLHAESPEPADLEKAPPHGALRGLGIACLRAALLALTTYSLAVTAWRARHEPRDLALVVGACAVLAALCLCLRRAERITPASPAGERWWVQLAVWALSTALSLAFAHRVAALMPPALAVVVWCMTSVVVLAGFYMLMLCKDRQYQAQEDVDCCDADGMAFKKMSPADELGHHIIKPNLQRLPSFLKTRNIAGIY